MAHAALQSDQAGAHPSPKPPTKRKHCHHGHDWREPSPADAHLTCAGCDQSLKFRDINVATFAQILSAVARRHGHAVEEEFQQVLYTKIRDALGLGA